MLERTRVGLVSVVELALAGEENHAFALLQAFVKEALEGCAIRISLLPQALLDAFFPFAFVVPLAVGSVVLAVAVRLVDVPLALIIAAVFVDHYPEALPSVLDPVADVVQPLSFVDHDAQTMAGLALLADEHSFFWEFGGVGSGYFGIVVRVGQGAEGSLCLWIEVEEAGLVDVLGYGRDTSSGLRLRSSYC